MPHIIKPLLVVGILRGITATPVVLCCFESISVKDINMPETSTPCDGTVSCTFVGALFLVSNPFWRRVSAYTLGAVLETSILVASFCPVGAWSMGTAEINTPKKSYVP